MDKIDDRIAINTKVCHGKPHIKGTRIMVQQILGLLASGAPVQEIIEKDFPDLDVQDIQACLTFANQLVRDEEIFVYETNSVEAI